jgi:hypothetical protein
MLRVCLLLTLVACGGSPSRSYDTTPTSALAYQPSPWETSGTVKAEATLSAGTMAREAPASPLSGVGGAIGSLFAGPAAAPVAQVVTANTPKEPEKLVIEAWIDMQVDDVARETALIRARVEADGGRVVSENVIGPAKAAASAALELRVPPEKAAGLQSWLATRGVIESRRVLASDVGKQLFDQELALKNLEVTMERLQKLAARDAAMKELIEIENEMTRVRGQIEKIKGEHRWLLDRVAFATITLTLRREGGPIEFAPHARIHPGAHIATLTLLDPGDRPRSRVGGGLTLHVKRYLTLDFDLFPAKDGDTRAAIGTIGTALYSSFLGNGRRKYLNPYLGLRAGFGYLSDDGCFVTGAEFGLELYKQKYIQISVAVRALAFVLDDRTDGALHGMAGFEVPF